MPGTTTPRDWATGFSGPPDFSSEHGSWSTALLRYWSGTSPDMDQPPLDHHYIVQHLGGPKLVQRHKDGAPISTTVGRGAITVVPVGTEYKWRTQGPIAFAHLYLAPSALEVAAQRYGRSGTLCLTDAVGSGHGLLVSLFSAMLEEAQRGRGADALYLDCLLDTVVFTLLRQHSTSGVVDRTTRERLPKFLLGRITEYIHAHLSEPIALADLVALSGVSLFHFVRAFRNTVGVTPYQFVLQERITRAKDLLQRSTLPPDAIASACGFKDAGYFSKAFSRTVGQSPLRFRAAAARRPL
jgi:AraC family transcriptional regulator